MHEAGDGAEWLSRLDALAAALASAQISSLPPGAVADAVRGALPARLHALFVRHAVLVPPADENSRLRLARAAGTVDAALLSHLPAPGAGASAATALAVASDGPAAPAARAASALAAARALRVLLFASTRDIAAALGVFDEGHGRDAMGILPPAATAERARLAASLKSLHPADILHALASRLPSSAPSAHGRGGQTGRAYSDTLDMAEVVGGDIAAASIRARLFPTRAGLIAQDVLAAERVAGCVDDWRRAASASGRGGRSYSSY